jgi:hypothetical protein
MADTQNWTDRHHELATTRTGIKIGSAYQAPPPLDALMKWLGMWK